MVNRLQLKNNWHRYLFAVIIGLFVLQGAYFALRIKFELPPDEGYHFEFIKQYSEVLYTPENSPETYQFGPINHKPYLYHFLFGKLLHLNIFGIEDFVFIRLLNIFLGVATIITTYKITSIFTKRKTTKLLSAFLIANTLMFVFLSGSINYDNLVNLLAALSILFTLKFTKSRELRFLLLFISTACAGVLTKISFIPLALTLGLIISMDIIFSQLKNLRINPIEFKKQINILNILLFATSMILIVLSLRLYIGNFLNFGGFEPSCDQVLTQEQCLNDPIYTRAIEGQSTQPENLMNPFEYFFRWYFYMQQKSLGILAHQTMIKPLKYLIPYNILIILSLFLYLKHPKLIKQDRKLLIYLGITVISYLLILAFYQNYQTYLATGEIGRALQGRYAFPVLSGVYMLFLYPFDKYLNKKHRLILYILITAIFLWGGFFFFITNVPGSWLR
ncbi:phospholipid carrier-dependent glycosyltransferase [Candidatus Dojkabacteria bacterium]|nr:phospholipid carrier-dependent glycosyltransferase [Candidatus Dojkabacteria bacterium]